MFPIKTIAARDLAKGLWVFDGAIARRILRVEGSDDWPRTIWLSDGESMTLLADEDVVITVGGES